MKRISFSGLIFRLHRRLHQELVNLKCLSYLAVRMLNSVTELRFGSRRCVFWRHNPEVWLPAVLVTAKLPPKSVLTWDVRQDDFNDPLQSWTLCVWNVWVGAVSDLYESISRPCCLVLNPFTGWIAAAGFCSVHSTRQVGCAQGCCGSRLWELFRVSAPNT